MQSSRCVQCHSEACDSDNICCCSSAVRCGLSINSHARLKHSAEKC
ncbi:MAG: hypothetical protein WC058_13855 [Phycisphaeraceae bacterium]